MESKNAFGENLVELRNKLGMTRCALAQALGINENTLTGYENSGREPKYNLLVKIADFFDVLVDELIRDSEFIEIPIRIISDDKQGYETSVFASIYEADKNPFGLLESVEKVKNLL